MTRTTQEFIEAEDHLPCFLKDFHEQKAFFKTMHDFYAGRETGGINQPNWIEGHCYILDRLLKFLALHGYTIQRNRSNVAFHDLQQTISEFEKKAANSLGSMLEGAKNAG